MDVTAQGRSFDDDYLRDAQKYLKKAFSEIEKEGLLFQLTDLYNFLLNVNTRAMVSGETSRRVNAYLEIVGSLKNEALNLKSDVNETVAGFIRDLDTADGVLY